MVKGGEMGDFGGAWLEHPKQWLPGVPEEAQQPSWGSAQAAL